MKWLKELHPPEKMVFLAGPRQVGKTTLVKQILSCSIFSRHAISGLILAWEISGYGICGTGENAKWML